MLKMVCSYCGSEEVMKDAYASWNVEKQEWELAQVFDKGAVCENCDGECSVKEQEFLEDESNNG